MSQWGHGGIAPPIYSSLQESWSKKLAWQQEGGYSIFCDLFCLSNKIVTTVGQLVRTPPPHRGCLRTSLSPGDHYSSPQGLEPYHFKEKSESALFTMLFPEAKGHIPRLQEVLSKELSRGLTSSAFCLLFCRYS